MIERVGRRFVSGGMRRARMPSFGELYVIAKEPDGLVCTQALPGQKNDGCDPLPPLFRVRAGPAAGIVRGTMQFVDLNTMDRAEFVATLGGIFEHSPWVAEQAIEARPFAGVDALHGAMMAAVRDAPASLRFALLRAHPELAGKAAIRRQLTVESTNEQSGAGLDRCSPEEFARLAALNVVYNAKFGFPFILAVKGYDRAGILREFARRVEHDRDTEHDEALAQIARITRFRLDALFEEG